MENKLKSMGLAAREAARSLALAGRKEKDRALREMASSIRSRRDSIVEANGLDLEEGRKAGLSEPLLERLTLDDGRIESMAAGLEQIAVLPDPIGSGLGSYINEDGLEISRVRVPLGVIGMIYESRPNVTADAAGLCLKSGNAVILRGGKEAHHSNRAIAEAIGKALGNVGFPAGAVQLLDDPGREATQALMALDSLDVLIPRGGKGLKAAVKQHAKVPVIMTGMGLCHLYVDSSADVNMAVRIAVNAKAQRPSVCNSIETLLVHSDVASRFLPPLVKAMEEAGVELRGDDRVRKVVSMNPAVDDDWDTEYLALILSIKMVDSLDQAMDHIHLHGSGHSEAIVTRDYGNSRRFLDGVDAAAVYVNASTRFTDGAVFGLGAEMGISTQKLHARGPMGVEQLTTVKFRVSGSGQIRS
ncbi:MULTISPECIES: glutamate-5-semialdehyde dehydrogenase [Dethiosulfovibrio]|uniref:Gamma-glutamyl phosphate reductase n=2 Tax=Dethiosulfovibrio TaxID=47054 RepID=A0ABS9EPY6_9BACT|nr:MULTISPECIES: glutamate-5-semialdehyde dehydrogenase [Dethiosulfovibrio]MCF4114838.1 glutamate-5-semialdehyde dehydrogenase [Dethiosulfovibrio russensis]MCF4143235.1 glutamate-5-semialdehyde dehydrogenase [Dethiosulfovibrio marinus]MCF4145343.1 glutamate-5-semialdehyde dehydrogenase [Dethiosulfovibrio acidaminovorans]